MILTIFRKLFLSGSFSLSPLDGVSFGIGIGHGTGLGLGWVIRTDGGFVFPCSTFLVMRILNYGSYTV